MINTIKGGRINALPPLIVNIKLFHIVAVLVSLLHKIMVGKFYFVLFRFKENGGNAFNAKIKEPRVQTRFLLAEAKGACLNTEFYY